MPLKHSPSRETMDRRGKALRAKLSTCSSRPGVPCTTPFKPFSFDSYGTFSSELSLNAIPSLLLKIVRKVSWKIILWVITLSSTILPNVNSSLLGISASLFLSDASLLTLTPLLYPHYKEGKPVNSLRCYAENPMEAHLPVREGKKKRRSKKKQVYCQCQDCTSCLVQDKGCTLHA